MSRRPTAEDDRKFALERAEQLRGRGYNVLPADETLRRPTYGYSQYWEKVLPWEYFETRPTSCIQVMTGRFWGLLVVDLDGPEAPSQFDRIRNGRKLPVTWRCLSGGGGIHLWFSIPKEGRPLPNGPYWVGEGKHNRIDRICDHGLIVAPPSIHHRTGKRYVWENYRCSPDGMKRPADAPSWLLSLPTEHEKRKQDRKVRIPTSNDQWSHIDKIGLLKSWGIRFTGTRRRSGWHECYAAFRDEEHPSAACHEDSGYYVDLGGGETSRLSLPELGVALGIYPTIEEALRGLNGKTDRPETQAPHFGHRRRLVSSTTERRTRP